MSIYHNSSSSTTINNLIQHRARAINSIPYSQTTTTFIDSPGPAQNRSSPLFTITPRVKSVIPISPALSSPSLYSRVGHSSPIGQVQMATRTSKKLQVVSNECSETFNRSKYTQLNDEDDVELDGESDMYNDEEDDDPRRMSMVGGPKVRKYTQVPWEEEDDEDENQWSMVPTSVHRNNTTSIVSNTHSNSGVTGVTVVGSADMFSGFSKHANRMINNVVSQSNNISSSKVKPREREQSTISTLSNSTILSNSNSDNLSIDNTYSTRCGLSNILNKSNNSSGATTKHLLPSASGLSLASNQTTTSSSSSSSVSDDRSTPITPKLRSNSNGKIENSPTITFNSSSKKISSFNDYDDHHQSNIGLLPAVIPKAINTYRKPVTPPVPNEILTLTPNLNTNSGVFAAKDRPLLNSGSPGFGLITLEAAQERERMKSQPKNSVLSNITNTIEQTQTHHRSNTTTAIDQQQKRPLTTFSIPPIPDEPINPLRPTTSCTSTPSSPPTNNTGNGSGNRVKSKKSGLMRLFNKSDKNIPPIPTTNIIGIATPTSKSRDGSGRASLWSSSNEHFGGQSSIPGESAVWPSDSKSASSGKKVHQQPQQIDNTQDKDKLSISTIKPKLELRPVSMTFSRGLPVDYLITGNSRNISDNNASSKDYNQLSQNEENLIPPLPSTPTSILKKKKPVEDFDNNGILSENNFEMNKQMKEQILNAKKAWKLQLFELEAQIRELKDELAEAKVIESGGGNYDKCGCNCNGNGNGNNSNDMLSVNSNNGSSKRVIDRARVKTAGARGVFGSGSLYEWE